jgi:hypothetical protein
MRRLALPSGRPHGRAPAKEDALVTPSETRILELLEQLEATLAEVRELIERRLDAPASSSDKAVRAFTDELFRERDA